MTPSRTPGRGTAKWLEPHQRDRVRGRTPGRGRPGARFPVVMSAPGRERRTCGIDAEGVAPSARPNHELIIEGGLKAYIAHVSTKTPVRYSPGDAVPEQEPVRTTAGAMYSQRRHARRGGAVARSQLVISATAPEQRTCRNYSEGAPPSRGPNRNLTLFGSREGPPHLRKYSTQTALRHPDAPRSTRPAVTRNPGRCSK